MGLIFVLYGTPPRRRWLKWVIWGMGYTTRGTCKVGAALSVTKNVDPVRCHQRLGQPSHGSLASLSANCGFKLNRDFLDCCDVCHRIKQTTNSFPLSESWAHKPFELIQCDLWGHDHIPSLSGCHCFLCIVDDFSRATWVYLLRNKSETCDRIVQFCCMVKVWDTY